MSTKVDNQVFDSQQQEQTRLPENVSESSLRLQKFPPRKMIDSNDQDMSGNFISIINVFLFKVFFDFSKLTVFYLYHSPQILLILRFSPLLSFFEYESNLKDFSESIDERFKSPTRRVPESKGGGDFDENEAITALLGLACVSLQPMSDETSRYLYLY